MARVTVEDCIQKVENRFELVILAAFRANKINAGAPITIDREKDKSSVLALREIAEETVSISSLRDLYIKNHQSSFEIDRIDNDSLMTEAFSNHAEESYSEEDLTDLNLGEDENFDDGELYSDSEEDPQ